MPAVRSVSLLSIRLTTKYNTAKCLKLYARPPNEVLPRPRPDTRADQSVIIEEHTLYTYTGLLIKVTSTTHPAKRLCSSVSRSRRREASRSIVPERIIGQGLAFSDDRFDAARSSIS